MPTNHKILHYNSIRRKRESPKYYYSINQFLEPLSMPRQEKKKKRKKERKKLAYKVTFSIILSLSLSFQNNSSYIYNLPISS